MRVLIRPVLWCVSALIFGLTASGIALEWTATRLVPLQKFLTKLTDRSA